MVTKSTPAKTSKNEIINGLNKVLADTYTLYLKTQNYHWNVTGANFYALHLLFEKQYEELGDAADTLAERIRSLQAQAPGSFSEFSKLTTIKEAVKSISAHEMLKQLAHDHEQVIATLNPLIPAAQGGGDEATADLYIERLHAHYKAAWMLRSSLS